MEAKKYVLRAHISMPGVPYTPLWSGDHWTPVGWAAKLYDTPEIPEEELFAAAVANPEAIGNMFVEEKREH